MGQLSRAGGFLAPGCAVDYAGALGRGSLERWVSTD